MAWLGWLAGWLDGLAAWLGLASLGLVGWPGGWLGLVWLGLAGWLAKSGHWRKISRELADNT